MNVQNNYRIITFSTQVYRKNLQQKIHVIKIKGSFKQFVFYLKKETNTQSQYLISRCRRA
jgi:hypothetical protein